jgi:23S rRNA (cytosine1962-C5)-methyltransferase
VRAVNVDISKKNLNNGKENYLLNEIKALPGEFFCGSSEEYVDWAMKKGKKFGAIALDPPSFAKNGKKIFSVANDFENLATKTVALLEDEGILLLATNYSEWSDKMLQKAAKNAFAKNGKEYKILAKGAGGEDFPGSGHSKESCMNFVIYEVFQKF